MGLRDGVELAAVTAYLAAAGVYLRLSGQLRPSFSLALLAARRAQVGAWGVLGSTRGELRRLRHERGHAFVGKLPLTFGAPSDAEGRSAVVLLEDDRPLGPAHAALHEVVGEGGGRYYHWYGAIVFSTPDGTDPRTNGRRYTARLLPE